MEKGSEGKGSCEWGERDEKGVGGGGDGCGREVRGRGAVSGGERDGKGASVERDGRGKRKEMSNTPSPSSPPSHLPHHHHHYIFPIITTITSSPFITT
ncbi:hypothetical protein Pcinc_043126 [Petrolisthes cinctipes]|uniref:Uncharacterized protein n=1 Tax=Petrolisthes cinctipes TaxID=88211 RepID=A0AAE1BG51_PETCI|nr:hypothetical protein Pcinc_043126 [Petrolisthes cinctipes]